MQNNENPIAKQSTFILAAKYSKSNKNEIYSCMPRSIEMDDISYDSYTLL